MRDGVCISQKEFLGAMENRAIVFAVESSHSRMLARLVREEALRSFANCIRE